ncbi:hypothetical protein [Kitasatospora indigofera]|uniref:hypothetical protein n=1 Tax=Kitasatospora indigofera TaxID=67307 RepID=UPI0036795DFC
MHYPLARAYERAGWWLIEDEPLPAEARPAVVKAVSRWFGITASTLAGLTQTLEVIARAWPISRASTLPTPR